jgi:SNF2 family DNA or RNA helicase
VPPILTRNGDLLQVSLDPRDGARFRDAKEQIREIPGRRWDPDTLLWSVPASAQTAQRIIKMIHPEYDDELKEWITEQKGADEESLTSPLPDDNTQPLLVPWAAKRCPWQPEEVNDEPYNGLLPYQRAAVQVMAERGRAILADDMGLGKTFEAISAVEEWCLRNGQVTGPKLVIAPSSVKGSWARELRRWLDLSESEVVVIKGTYGKRKGSPEEFKRLGYEQPYPLDLTPADVRRLAVMNAIDANAWVIVNWEQLRIEKIKIKLRNGGTKTVRQMKEPLFESTEWLAVIADEVHRAKNPKALQSLGLWRTHGKVMYALTGTPIMNSPDELWSPMRWLWPDEYGNSLPESKANPQGVPKVPYGTFYEDHVDYWEDHRGRKFITGVKNPDALRYVLEDKLIRRTSSILGLKGRRRIYTPLDLNPKQQKLYDDAETAMWLAVAEDASHGNKEALDFLAAAEEGDVASLIRIPNGGARIVRLQQVIENATLLGGPDDSALMDYFEQRYLDSRPEPWVIFTKFKMSTHLLAERLKKHGANVGVYTGDVKGEGRTRLEDRFQRGELDVMVGTIGAMKEGITLTAARLTGFLTRDWVPDVNEQCESRCDRLGQQREVLVDIPLAENTVATGLVEPKNRLKERIVRTVLPKDKVKEAA